MTRTKRALSSILTGAAVAVALSASAYAAPSDSSLNAALNDGTPASQSISPSPDQTSLNATLQDGGGQPVDSGTPVTTVSVPNAILGPAGQPATGSTPIAGGEDGGFEWGDALIGAGSALGMVLLALGALALSRRRRHPEDPVPA